MLLWSQNCGGNCSQGEKPATHVSCVCRPGYGSEDSPFNFGFWLLPSSETQSEFEQAVVTLARAGESQTALGESLPCGATHGRAPRISGFIPVLVLAVIRLQDGIVILNELIARTDNEEKLSGE